MSYELQLFYINGAVAPLNDFPWSLTQHSLCPKQDTRNSLHDIDTLPIAVPLEGHSDSKCSKHSIAKHRSNAQFHSLFTIFKQFRLKG